MPVSDQSALPEAAKEQCGIIMPIAAMPGYEETHWATVIELIGRAVTRSGMVPAPVWARGSADVLQERIVRNLYEQPYAICDISGQNPNVMLELGIRLAFGKPTIIINDEEVRAPFDIGAIEYVPYGRGLQILQAENFIDRLAGKIDDVRQAVNANAYKAYIKTFGPIEFGAPGDESIPLGRAVLDQLEELSRAVRRMAPADRVERVQALAEGYSLQDSTALKHEIAYRTSRTRLEIRVTVDPAKLELVVAQLMILPNVKAVSRGKPGDVIVSVDSFPTELAQSTASMIMQIAKDNQKES